MATVTSIEWTDRTWNPTTGCSHVSPGCENCYAEKISTRFKRTTLPWKAQHAAENVETHPDRLTDPLTWRKPQRVFVDSMSDLFHPQVPISFIKEVFTIMAIAKRQTFQILTKRPERALDVVSSWRADDMYDYWHSFDGGSPGVEAWPLPNVWLGVSVEDQRRADERIPLLLQMPAAVRFLSCEPLLGPLDLRPFLTVTRQRPWLIDWAIVGGESGAGSRPFDLAWARSIVSQCKNAGVPCFVKQLGAKPVGEWGQNPPTVHVTDVTTQPVRQYLTEHKYKSGRWRLSDPKGGYMPEWPEDLRVREFPHAS